MNQLLINELFDNFLLCDGEITTTNSFKIDGRTNKSFYSEDQLDSIENFILWKNIKHICFEIVKGKKVPSKMKFVLATPTSNFEKILTESGATHNVNDIGGLYLHVHFENNEITCITGTSLNTFTLDKTLDIHWDNLIFNFLNNNFICVKE